MEQLITSDDIERSTLTFNTGILKHNLNLTPTIDASESIESIGSTYHDKWIVVDHIFYSLNQQNLGEIPKINLIANYQLPTIDKCRRIGPIPNQYYGSDHYSIAARFAFN